MPRQLNRLVCGHDENGKSVFLSDGPPPQFHGRRGRGVEFHEVWATEEMPARIGSAPDKEPNDRPLRLPPTPNGTVVRILDIHPGHVDQLPKKPDGSHPGIHRTKSIDYGILIEGEIYLILDDGEERLMLPGDVAIQLGANHAWENRSDKVARIAFILIDGEFTDELKAKLPGMKLQDKSFTQISQDT